MIKECQIITSPMTRFLAITVNWHAYVRCMARCLFIIAGLAVLTPAQAQEQAHWPDTFVARLGALALMQTLNAEILGSKSATRSLESWCRDHQLAEDAKIRASLVAGVNKPPTEKQRQHLMVTAQDEVKYRRVQLRCGVHVLSEAENWYVPSRLTPEMNRLLETTETPFGKAVESLEPYRQTFFVMLLWTPLPDGWEREPGLLPTETDDNLAIPDALFEHRALLYTREHKPFAEVFEVYQRHILAFPPQLPRTKRNKAVE